MLPFPHMPNDLNSEMQAAAEGAVQHARKHWSTELDFSASSVEEVELILARMHESIPKSKFAAMFKKGPTEEQKAQVALAYGAYIGEVLRREFGGDWSTETVEGRDAVALNFNPANTIFPPAKVWKRLHNGPEDDIKVFYDAIRARLRECS